MTATAANAKSRRSKFRSAALVVMGGASVTRFNRPQTRRGYVWKFENNRFVPIEVETGIADESWTELVSGEVRAGDRLVTAAAPLKRSS